MCKKVKCSQCKHLLEKGTTKNLIGENRITFTRYDTAYESRDNILNVYSCGADRSLPDMVGEKISRPRKCPCFRSRTLTARQEIWQDIFQVIPNAIKSVINYFLGN